MSKFSLYKRRETTRRAMPRSLKVPKSRSPEVNNMSFNFEQLLITHKVSLFFRFLFDGLGEEAEIHFAIMSLLHEMRMFLKVLVFVVLQNEHAAFT